MGDEITMFRALGVLLHTSNCRCIAFDRLTRQITRQVGLFGILNRDTILRSTDNQIRADYLLPLALLCVFQSISQYSSNNKTSLYRHLCMRTLFVAECPPKLHRVRQRRTKHREIARRWHFEMGVNDIANDIEHFWLDSMKPFECI